MSVSFGPLAWRAAIAGAFVVVVPTLVVAQEAAPPPLDPVEIQTITVTADPFARTSDELVQPTEILAGEELDRRRGATLGETLEHELGVSSTDFGRGAGRPVIRGQGGPRVQMLENGISSMDASDVSSDHDVSIDPAQADQIEILKGPATLIYGSSASAGVVNVVDQRLPNEVTEGSKGKLRSGFGSNGDERNTSGYFAYGVGGTQLRVDGAYLDADDYDIDGNSAADGSGTDGVLPNSAVERKSGAVSAAQFWERGSLAASVSQFETTYGLPNEEAAFIDLEQTRVDIEARVLKPFDGWDSIRFRAGFNDYEHTEFEGPGEPGTVFKNQQNESRIELVHQPFAGFRGVFGVQRRDREFQAIGDEAFVPFTDTRGVGVFLIEQQATSFGSIELGVRSDQDKIEPQETDLAPRKFSPVSLSGGALFELDEKYHVKFNATRAQRSPVAEELYSFGPHLATSSFERGDASFDVETANNLELSLDRHGGPINWRINLFYQRISDYVFQQEIDAGLDADGGGVASVDGIADRVDEEGAFDPDGELLLLNYRSGEARFWGTECEIGYGWQLGETELRARAFGDLVRGRIADGDDLPRITPARLGLGFHAHGRPWSASVDFTRVQKQDRIASLETGTDGYALLSVDADYEFGSPVGTILIFLRGRNLLDEDARRHTSFIKNVAPLPGASVTAGLEWRFE
ncbi:MAG: TonB-dependent receptor [Panacagrimonas sp.]